MKCYRCKEDKPSIDFTKSETLKKGSKCCRECRSKYNKKHMVENIKKYKIYYKENKERVLENQKKYNNENWDEIQRKNKVRNQLPSTIQKRKDRWNWRYNNDLNFKLKMIMKGGFSRFFKDKGETKNLSFSKVVNYNYSELKTHLEEKFREGMNWDNYGELWEIHHIKPQSLFSCLDIKEVKKCWRLSNTIPLWKTNEISQMMGDDTIGNRNVKLDKIYHPKFGYLSESSYIDIII